ncbi:MAG TPA: DUF488 domain-containing protein [Tepidisphaeraceae bacterium]|jgi:uncharacterized protein (DUF488 family)|nr:DUF488 domain-containing protein [Tepidisphaeraceae bacterium]
MPGTLYTLGHSTRPWPDFLTLLHSHHIRQLADVRRFPGSRKYPHFNATHLTSELPKHHISYHPFPTLGGRRKPLPDSPNSAWRNDAFRGYADYMLTPDFQSALTDLEQLATKHPTAIMCAESLPWRCHRSLIADAMIARGWTVLDIMTPTSAKPHHLPAWAHIIGTTVIYPAPDDLFTPNLNPEN